MVKELLKSVGQYKRDSILTPTFVAMEVVMEVVIPMLMARLIDDGITPGRMDMILKVGAVLAACAVVSLVFGALSGHFAAKASSGFAKNLRQRMYYKVQDFSFANIDRFSTASLITRLTTDVQNVQNAYQMVIRIAVRSPVMLIFSLFMAFQVNPTLSLIFLCAIPVLGVGLFLIATRAHPVFERVFRTYDKLNNVVQENLRGIRVVKSFVREEHEEQKFGNISNSIYQDFSRAEKILAFNGPLMQFVMYACMLLISWFGAQLIVSATMSTGQLMSLLSYSSQILMSLNMLAMIFVMITISRASMERITEVLQEESSLKNPENPIETVANGEVIFDHVNFSYSGREDNLCLKDVCLTIPAGSTVGVIGGTGSAKTTLVQLIPRLYDVTSGVFRVGGVDVRDYD